MPGRPSPGSLLPSERRRFHPSPSGHSEPVREPRLGPGKEGRDVGPGVALLVIGAIFTFAIRRELPGIDLQTVGVILMLAGAAMVARARRSRVHEQESTRVEEPVSPADPTHMVVRERTTERDTR
jgi:hypothetical protein